MKQAPHAIQEKTKKSLLMRLVSVLGVTIGAVALVGLTATGIALLHMRAAAEAPRKPAEPVRVVTKPVALVDHYNRRSSFTGRIEAARQTSLAFEFGGLVTEVLFDEGQDVAAGEVVARLDTAKLAVSRRQLEARQKELQAQRRLAQLTLRRQSTLKQGGWSPDQRIDEAETSVAQLTAAIEAVAAQIAGIDIDLSKAELRAPFAGRIAGRSIDEGAVVAAGAPVLTVLETGRLQARIGVPPTFARELVPSATYTLGIGSSQIKGSLIARRSDLDTGTRTVTALFNIDDHLKAATLGDLVTLSIESRVQTHGAWLPVAALKEGLRGLWTILIADRVDGKTVARTETVEVLHTEGDQVFVRGTFREGDEVLSIGTHRVVAGQVIALSGE